MIAQPSNTIKDIYPLSPMQEGMLYHYLLDQKEASYFEQTSYHLSGQLDIALVREAYQQLVIRYDILRTIFVYEDLERPLQIVLAEREGNFIYEDISEEVAAAGRDIVVQRYRQADRKRKFRLSEEVPIRMSIYQTGEQDYEFIWSAHHILMDGWCVSILVSEFSVIYRSLLKGIYPDLPPVQPYSDYITWLENRDKKATVNYWQQYLAGYESVAAIPVPKQMTRGFELGIDGIVMDEQTSLALKRICTKYSITLNTLLQGAWGIVLSKYNNSQDVVFGSVVSGRPAELPGVEKMIGLFINTMPVRIKYSGEESVSDFLSAIQEQALESEAHHYSSLPDIQAVSVLGKDLLDHIMIYYNYPSFNEIADQESDYEVTNFEVFQPTTYNLSLVVMPGNEINVNFNYNTHVYDKATIEQVAQQLQQVIHQMAANADMSVSKISLLTAAEKKQLTHVFNNTTLEYNRDASIIDLFREQVQVHGDQPAVVAGDVSLSYRELDEKSDQLAGYLLASGITTGNFVGLMMDRSADIVIGMLGILKAGAAYLPLDPALPGKRISNMIAQSEMKLLLADAAYVTRYAAAVPTKDIRSAALYQQSASSNVTGKDLAYCIFTSGSTGVPKGVMMSHRAVVNLVKGLQVRVYNRFAGERLRVGWLASFAFDASVQQIFAALLLGHSLYICAEEDRKDGEKMLAFYNEQQIDVSDGTPTHLRLLVDALASGKLTGLRSWILAGELLSRSLVKAFYASVNHVRLYNFYGPTETCVDSTGYAISAAALENYNTIPIGRPLANERVYITDNFGNLLPVGVKGELCIAGDGLAQQYTGDWTLTTERFVTDWVVGEARVYRTGDLGCWLPDGNIAYLGRKDSQVKLRGYRVELSEIAHQLQNFQSVRSAVVQLKEVYGEEHLVAYYVADQPLSASALRTHLLDVLPEYMVPSYFVHLEQLPQTLNGKVDYQALPAVEAEVAAADQHASNETEEKLVDIWSEILKLDKAAIGVQRSFFELGGHSLKLVYLANRLKQAFSTAFTLTQLIELENIRSLAQAIDEKTISVAYEPIRKVAEKEYYFASSGQQRSYFLYEFDRTSLAYNLPQVVELEGLLDIARLTMAFRQLIARHESLRTCFRVINGEVYQQILPELPFEPEMLEADDTNVNAVIKNFIRPFDLEQAPLMRVGLVKLPTGAYLLLVDMHHIITDGVSQGILIKDFMTIYTNQPLAPLALQYKDYAEWQREEHQQKRLAVQRSFWTQEFTTPVSVLELPTDFARPLVRSYAGDNRSFTYDKNLTSQLKELGDEVNATLFMTLLSAFNILLSKLSNQEDICIGTPVAGRDHADVEGIMGMFMNTLVLRNYPGGNLTFRDFLKQVKTKSLQCFEHQSYQYEELINTLNVSRNTGRNPLFDVLFVLQNIEQSPLNIPGIRMSSYSSGHRVSKFDLSLIAEELDGDLLLNFEYSTALFKQETVEKMIAGLERVVKQVIANPDIKLSEIDILSEEERELLLVTFNTTAAAYPKEKTVMDLFEAQVQKHPERTAVIFGDSRLSFAALHERSTQIAAYLREVLKVNTGDLVGVLLEREAELLPVIFGIMKSGGVYVPLSVHNPAARTSTIMANSRMKVLISRSAFITSLTAESCQVIDLDTTLAEIKAYNAAAGFERPTGNDLAYVIYTSGSTGTPKGVMIEHHSVVDRLQWMQQEYQLTADDIMLLKTPLVFDVSICELFWWAVTGSSLCLLPPEDEKDPRKVAAAIEKQKITLVQFVPTMLSAFLTEVANNDYQLHSLRIVLACGEALGVDHVARFGTTLHKPFGTSLHNLYGPTEATLFASYYPCNFSDTLTSIPIGKPMDNTTLYTLNEYGKLTPIGVPGELYIGGAGLARGYLHNEDMTRQKFIDHPLAPGGKLYRTGDLARFLPDGNIEFLGRIDSQVKIRGFRIELEEISTALTGYTGITDAVVITKTKEDDKFLVAYYTAVDEIPAEALKLYLSARLPEYMVPPYLVHMDAMPVTANGKVNTRALPDVEIIKTDEYTAPAGEAEQSLAEIWADVLKLDKELISADSSFFELGGHSLRAVTLVIKINKRFEIDIPLKEVFTYITIQQQAEYIKTVAKGGYQAIKKVRKKKYYALSSAQTRLYFLYEFDPASIAYNMPAVIELEGELDQGRLELGFRQLISRHESLRTAIVMVDGVPVQQVLDAPVFAIEKFESTDTEAVIRAFIRPFDLAKAPLIRVGLLHLPNGTHLLLIDMHHIISDGVSQSILIKDFMSLYNGEQLSELQLQYKDYAEWQKDGKQQQRLAVQREFWLKEFAEHPPVMDLPGDFQRPRTKSFAGSNRSFELDKDTTRKLKELGAETGATMFMTVLSAFTVLLSKLSNQQDIVVGTQVAGRDHADLEHIIGIFLNALALRNQVDGEQSFRQMLSDVKNKTLAAFENMSYPFEELVDELQIARDISRNPLFNVMFVYRNYEQVELMIPGLKLKGHDNGHAISKLDLTLTAGEFGGKLQLNFEYSTALFKAETIERFVACFIQLMAEITTDAERKLSRIGIMNDAEKQKILHVFNKTALPYNREASIIDLFRQQVQVHAHELALVFGDASLTYRALDEKSDQLAAYLLSAGIGKGNIVGLMLDRSLEMIVGMLGILKAGAAYLPLDPALPEKRISVMIAQSDMQLLLSDAAYVTRYAAYVPVKEIHAAALDEKMDIVPVSPRDLAYCIFTSGSTGVPKGVLMSHQSVVNLISGLQERIYSRFEGQRLRVGCLASYVFDASVQQIFAALLQGHCLCICGDEDRKDGAKMLSFYNEQRIDISDGTPTHLRLLLEALDAGVLTGLRSWILAGEQLPKSLVKDFYGKVKHVSLYNFYGPTETCVDSSGYEINEDTLDQYQTIPIGRPLANERIYITDSYGNLLPVGVTGELCIAGDGLAQGYTGDPSLTADKFGADWVVGESRVYRTGDVGRWLPDGNIEYQGRKDAQIKLRGYRVELGEIAHQLETHEDISSAVVLLSELQGENHVVAYYVADQPLPAAALRTHLLDVLPEYMVPSYFVYLEQLPQTVNGKIDYKALPAAEATLAEADQQASNEIEERLVAIWREVLKLDTAAIGVHRSFFELGGHSLKAIHLVNSIKKEFSVSMKLIEIFTNTTIAQQAEMIELEMWVSGDADMGQMDIKL
ncbi:amino acid adenylation domain-containing protein [Chitinophaga sp.]|uniref:non-ribosomal peptide synthetase n=1 Tax=Chitinophaga sp. TaxID=1869181 RepID=UPI002F93C2E3